MSGWISKWSQVVTTMVLLGAWSAWGGCGRPVGSILEPPTMVFPRKIERNLDLLFVIDNSQSMADEQEMLREQFHALMGELRLMRGGLPNIHVGVTSTDLGTGTFQVPYCEEFGGNQGNLLTGTCANPVGVPYIVDVEPRNCNIEYQQDGTCAWHVCQPGNCDHEPSTTFEEDPDTGCPRCRNYANQTLEDTFACIASLGIQGCGFEQPLEAMYKALDAENTHNRGFLRDDAYLGIILLTDEDDCSASTPLLFDGPQTDINSTLGPLTSYRCFEFGVTCDIDSRTQLGIRQQCVPREDPDALLHPVSRYVEFLKSLKEPNELTVAAIAGPVINQSVTVGLDEYSYPEVQPSCTTERGGAVSGIRLKSFIEAFNVESDLDWAYSSICMQTFAEALEGIGRKIRSALEVTCLPEPAEGCTDVAVEYGEPGDGQSCNDVCRPDCKVQEFIELGTPYAMEQPVPPCLEVCPEGACPGNTLPSLAYAGGHPEAIDPGLPVPRCWHLGYHPGCTSSRQAEMVISRWAAPPPRHQIRVWCAELPRIEEVCDDGEDDDGDCLIDQDDPDCQDGATAGD